MRPAGSATGRSMPPTPRTAPHAPPRRARATTTTALLLLLLGLVLVAPPQPAAAGPDHSPFRGCVDVYMHLGEHKRHAARDAVQALQAIAAHVGEMGLGRAPRAAPPHGAAGAAPPTQQQLEGWRAGNATRLRALLAGTGLGGSEMAAVALAHTCLSSRLNPDGFAGRPAVSILLNYFKRPHVVAALAAALSQNCEAAGVPCELVVNVDNPHEVESWVGEVVWGSGGGGLGNASSGASSSSSSSSAGGGSSSSIGGGGGGGGSFVVPAFSANLHEARGYNRAAKLARGRYLVIWQDDQLPPPSGEWLRSLLALMAAYPRLGVLGMNKFRLCRQKETNNKWGPTGWLPDARAGGVRWTFAHFVDFAPLAVRSEVFTEVGGLEEGVSLKGECGITGDWELCARVWMAGWQVGFSAMEGRVDDRQAPSGTHTPVSGEQCWGRQAHVGGRVLHMRYAASLPLFEEMCVHVRTLNALAFAADPSPAAAAAGNFCPYRLDRFSHFAAEWANCSAPPEADVAAVAAAWQLALPPLPPGAPLSERLGRGLGYPPAAVHGTVAEGAGGGAGTGAGVQGQVQRRRRASGTRRRRGRRRALLALEGLEEVEGQGEGVEEPE